VGRTINDQPSGLDHSFKTSRKRFDEMAHLRILDLAEGLHLIDQPYRIEDPLDAHHVRHRLSILNHAVTEAYAQSHKVLARFQTPTLTIEMNVLSRPSLVLEMIWFNVIFVVSE
jgi:hypothetical protein